jgi:AcrR family transcriptional regulator
MPSTRDRYRAQVRDEIKMAALVQLADAGPQGISVNAIAKGLGVSGPALYRYFATRDELLTELVADAYADLAAALRAAGPGLPAVARAYRAWALAQPHRYRLLFAPPVPGYDAHQERLVTASQEAMNVLLDAGVRAPVPRGLTGELRGWLRSRGKDAEPEAAMGGVTAWARLHGLVSLELAGAYDAMGLDAAALLEAEVAALQAAAGTSGG